jgi:hypothetical protein
MGYSDKIKADGTCPFCGACAVWIGQEAGICIRCDRYLHPEYYALDASFYGKVHEFHYFSDSFNERRDRLATAQEKTRENKAAIQETLDEILKRFTA